MRALKLLSSIVPNGHLTEDLEYAFFFLFLFQVIIKIISILSEMQPSKSPWNMIAQTFLLEFSSPHTCVLLTAWINLQHSAGRLYLLLKFSIQCNVGIYCCKYIYLFFTLLFFTSLIFDLLVKNLVQNSKTRSCGLSSPLINCSYPSCTKNKCLPFFL